MSDIPPTVHMDINLESKKFDNYLRASCIRCGYYLRTELLQSMNNTTCGHNLCPICVDLLVWMNKSHFFCDCGSYCPICHTGENKPCKARWPKTALWDDDKVNVESATETKSKNMDHKLALKVGNLKLATIAEEEEHIEESSTGHAGYSPNSGQGSKPPNRFFSKKQGTVNETLTGHAGCSPNTCRGAKPPNRFFSKKQGTVNETSTGHAGYSPNSGHGSKAPNRFFWNKRRMTKINGGVNFAQTSNTERKSDYNEKNWPSLPASGDTSRGHSPPTKEWSTEQQSGGKTRKKFSTSSQTLHNKNKKPETYYYCY